jgi:uncharacterized protein
MRFWDSSAIVPLLVEETSSDGARAAYAADPDVVVWWGTEVECASALARVEREGRITPAAVGEALRRMERLAAAWREVQPVAPVRRTALRLLRVHALRAPDALQLGAALVAAESHPRTLPFVTLDDRLALAADREGFEVIAPGS